MPRENGELFTFQETWFVRGLGFAVISSEQTRIDDGEYFWEYNKESNTVSRSKSQGTDELLDKALDIRKELERDCERYPKEDRKIDGVVHQCYRLTFHGSAKPADPLFLDFEHHRSLVFISPEFLVRRVEMQERVDGEWKARVVRIWEYDVPVDPKVFRPNFGDQVRVIDTDQAFEQLVAIEDAVHVEERDGLIFAIHRAERFQDGGVVVMSSVRGTEATLKKYPLKRRLIQPGRYISSPPAVNWHTSPQGDGYFRITLAEASHKGANVQWWIMVPRGKKPTWFEDNDGRVKLPIGIAPRGAYAENHKDEHGVVHQIRWEVALDVPRPATLPTLNEIASRVHADVALLEPVFDKHLDLGVQDRNGVSTSKFGSTDDVTPAEFAEAVAEHVRYWQRRDIEFQLERGASGQFDKNGVRR